MEPTQTHKTAPKCPTDAGSPRFDKNLKSTVSNILLTPLANDLPQNITHPEVTSIKSTTAQKSEKQKAKKKITSADFLNMLSHGGRTATAISNPTSVQEACKGRTVGIYMAKSLPKQVRATSNAKTSVSGLDSSRDSPSFPSLSPMT